MRILLLILLTFSCNLITEVPEPSYGLPELASEERIRELNTKKRAKVMTPSVARKVQRVIEASITLWTFLATDGVITFALFFVLSSLILSSDANSGRP